MNALRATMQRSSAVIGRTFLSTAAVKAPMQPLVPAVYNITFKKAFLSDPGTYPLIVVMTVATSVVFGMSANALMHYKNVNILPSHKHELIHTWGTEQHDSVTKVLTKQPIAFWSKAFKDIRHEGLGVNHDEWKESKEAYYKH